MPVIGSIVMSANSFIALYLVYFHSNQYFFLYMLGLHASISVHLSDRFYNRNLNRWESNFSMFHERVGAHVERVQNMYLAYTLLLRAVIRIKSKMSLVQFGVTDADAKRAKDLVDSLYRLLPRFPKGFDREFLAVSPAQVNSKLFTLSYQNLGE